MPHQGSHIQLDPANSHLVFFKFSIILNSKPFPLDWPFSYLLLPTLNSFSNGCDVLLGVSFHTEKFTDDWRSFNKKKIYKK